MSRDDSVQPRPTVGRGTAHGFLFRNPTPWYSHWVPGGYSRHSCG